MPTASLTLPPNPEHVRTARLVTVAAARRAGVPEDVVDDVRLAVGEAVARAVLRHASAGTDSDVEIVLNDDDGFVVEVRDRTAPELPDDDEGMALALVRAVVPEVEIEPRSPLGTTLRLRWPDVATA
ncbi:MAG TPA: ATP-binding protein [Candidatus Nanopelagicales bacterium]|nr:ATP-binding protein [Candidatus Nanopelagicales bacterium]